ncbi:DUF4012 domain-containing protein [Nocardioides salsibiostraticola]
MGVAGTLVILGVVWLGWSAQRAFANLRDAQVQAESLQVALTAGDQPSAEVALTQFQSSSAAAADATTSPGWTLLEWIPLIGDDARGLTMVSDVLSGLGQDAIPPLVESAGGINAGSFSPSDSQFPLEEIAALVAPATRSQTAFEQARERLEPIDSTGFAGPVQRAFDDLRVEVTSATETLDIATRAAQLMPSFLGAEGERDYLFIFQNNAEIRSTGGLPGSISRVRAADGRVRIAQQQSGGADFPLLDKPVLPLTDEEREVFGSQMGTYFLNANFTPDFPRAAELWRARWKARFDRDIDGIFTVDPVTLSYLIAATGPLEVAGFTFTAENIVQAVENQVYLSNPDPEVQDEILDAVAKKAFNAFANGRGNPVELIRGLVRGVTEGRVQLHSFVEEEQDLIRGTEVAGELVGAESSNPQVGVYLNDGTGSKMSFYLDYDVTVTPTNCRGGRNELLGSFTVTSATPPNAAALPDSVQGFAPFRDESLRPGQQLLVAHVMSPVGGSSSDFEIDGQPTAGAGVGFEGRDVVSLALVLDPGQTRTVTWSMKAGPGQDGDVEVTVTPGVAPEDESVLARSAC